MKALVYKIDKITKRFELASGYNMVMLPSGKFVEIDLPDYKADERCIILSEYDDGEYNYDIVDIDRVEVFPSMISTLVDICKSQKIDNWMKFKARVNTISYEVDVLTDRISEKTYSDEKLKKYVADPNTRDKLIFYFMTRWLNTEDDWYKVIEPKLK